MAYPKQKFFSSFCVMAAIFLFFIAAKAQNSAEIRKKQTVLQQKVQDKTHQIKKISSELDVLSSEIEKLKKKHTENQSVFRHYKLQTLMAKAQDRSDYLSALATEKNILIEELASVQKTYVRILEDSIEKKRRIANSHSADRETRSKAALALKDLLAQRVQVSDLASRDETNGVSANFLEETEAPEEFQDKLLLAKDIEKKMAQEVVMIETQLADVKRQRFLRQELTHLLDEESFFGEQNFVQGPIRKMEQKQADSSASLSNTDLTRKDVDKDKKETDSALNSSVGNQKDPLPFLSGSAKIGSPTSEGNSETFNSSVPSDSIDSVSRTDVSNAAKINAELSSTTKEAFSLDAESLRRPDEREEEISTKEMFPRSLFFQSSSSGQLQVESGPSPATASMESRIQWLEERLTKSRQSLKEIQTKIERLSQRATK